MMSLESELSKALAKARQPLKGTVPTKKELNEALRGTELDAQAPAPHLTQMVKAQGADLTANAVAAWDARVRGIPIVDIAHEQGVSIELARSLLKEAHAAITEDLKEALDQNRQLDLARVDGLIQTYYPPARSGDGDSAAVVLKCLAHRAKLTGIEPLPATHHTGQPQNVLVWIQNQLPNINRIVDALPLE